MIKDLIAGLTKTPEEMKQAEHLWKMLDEMAASNPD